jgi:hypothetical protein
MSDELRIAVQFYREWQKTRFAMREYTLSMDDGVVAWWLRTQVYGGITR